MKQIIETIITSDFEYLRLQYLIWNCNGLQSPTKLQANAGNKLADIVSNGNEAPLIINCSKISSVSNYSLEPVVSKIHETKREVFFLYSTGIGEELRKILPEFSSISIDSYCVTYFDKYDNDSINDKVDCIITNASSNVKDLCKKATDDEIKRIKTYLSKCFKKEDTFFRLKSTPILTNGVFNARRIILNPTAFMQTCLLLNEKA